MRLGLFMQPVHDPARDLGQVLAEDRETIILADRLGFSECWVGEHASATAEPITAPLIFLASLLGETKQIKLGTGVFCMPNHHPAEIAGQAALFDHLSAGRFQMGIGTGSLPSDIELFELGERDRNAMVTESMAHVQAIWDGEPPYERAGEHWRIAIRDVSRSEFGVGHFIKPYQQPHPPIAISIMSPGSGSALMAGQQGWIPISGAAFLQPRYTASHWEKYAEGCAAAGRRPDPSIWRVSRSIVVAPSDAEARDHVLDPDGAMAFWFRYFESAVSSRGLQKYAAPDGHPDPDNVTWQEIALSQVAWGSPATVVEKLVALQETTGPFGVLTAMAHEWTDAAFSKRSMTMLAEEVMPVFAQHADASHAA